MKNLGRNGEDDVNNFGDDDVNYLGDDNANNLGDVVNNLGDDDVSNLDDVNNLGDDDEVNNLGGDDVNDPSDDDVNNLGSDNQVNKLFTKWMRSSTLYFVGSMELTAKMLGIPSKKFWKAKHLHKRRLRSRLVSNSWGSLQDQS